jgi:hypothetical protein
MPASTKAQASSSPFRDEHTSGESRSTASRFQNEELEPLPAMNAFSGTALAFQPSAYQNRSASLCRFSSGKNSVADSTLSRAKVAMLILRWLAKRTPIALRPAGSPAAVPAMGCKAVMIDPQRQAPICLFSPEM